MPTYRDLTDDEVASDEPVGIDALLQFNGRVNRRTFWATWIGLAAAVFAAAFGASVFVPGFGGGNAAMSLIGGALVVVFSFLFLFLSLANEAKRWHDLGQSAWWLLLNLVPGLGVIVLLVLGLVPGNKGPNEYGTGPLKIRLNADA